MSVKGDGKCAMHRDRLVARGALPASLMSGSGCALSLPQQALGVSRHWACTKVADRRPLAPACPRLAMDAAADPAGSPAYSHVECIVTQSRERGIPLLAAAQALFTHQRMALGVLLAPRVHLNAHKT